MCGVRTGNAVSLTTATALDVRISNGVITVRYATFTVMYNTVTNGTAKMTARGRLLEENHYLEAFRNQGRKIRRCASKRTLQGWLIHFLQRHVQLTPKETDTYS